MANVPFNSTITGPNIENAARLFKFSTSNVQGGAIGTTWAAGLYLINVSAGVLTLASLGENGVVTSGLQTEITSQNKLASDLVDDTNQSNKFVSATEKAQITTNQEDIAALEARVTDFPTIPTIPDITVDNGNVESGKYISQVAVDETDKHKLNITKENLPTGFSGNYDDLSNKPTIPTVPTISTDIETDATSDIKTTSPKAVKTYVDNTISAIETAIAGIEELLEEI